MRAQVIEDGSEPARAQLRILCESLGVTANHAGVLVHRARQALRQSLANHLEERA